MLSDIIKKYTQKVYLPCWGGLIVIIFLDISTRLTYMETKQNLPWKVASEAKNEMLTLSQAQAEEIATAISHFEISSEVESKVNNTMSEAEQLAQQGDLQQLFAGDKRYRLVGIFDKSERFAVIQQLDTTLNKQELIKVTAAERLQGYEITKIFANKATLTSDDKREITLFLYKQLEKAI